MQTLVYFFIGLTGLAMAALAYFGLTFTIIEALLTGVIVSGLATLMLQRRIQQRSEARLTRSIEDLSRIVSANAHAGQVLSQRFNDLAKADVSKRVADIEADLSMLGDIVQNVAEATAEVEKSQQQLQSYMREGEPLASGPGPDTFTNDDSMLSVHDVQKALRDDRLEYHIEKIISLPQRAARGYQLIAMVPASDGELTPATDIAPGRGADGLLQIIEKMTLIETFNLAKKAQKSDVEVFLHATLSSATLADPGLVDEVAEILDTSRIAAKKISLIFSESDWRGLNAMERGALTMLIGKGVGISLDAPKNLRLNFAELFEHGITSVRADATRFINSPESYSDFHASDVADYVQRYEIDLIVTGVRSEQQVLSLGEDGVRFAAGNHIAPRRVVPHDLFPLRTETGNSQPSPTSVSAPRQASLGKRL